MRKNTPMRAYAIVFCANALLLSACTEQKPKEEKLPDQVVEPKKDEPTLIDTSSVMMETAKAETVQQKASSKPAVEKNSTVIGEVIDLVSYATSGVRSTSPSGKEIIEGNARGGNPIGILEKGTGDIYILTMKQANTSAIGAVLPFVGMNIAVKGDIYRKGGQQLLVMTTIGKSIN